MPHTICENIKQIQQEINNVDLVVVSKYRSLEELQTAYKCGHRVFGENRVQELKDKYEKLPKDIKWHLIGHLQSNKVKYIAPFVELIQSVDSFKLLKAINREAAKVSRTISFLFQLHIAQEETKFGLSAEELREIIYSEEFKSLKNVNAVGLMGMATFSKDQNIVKKEFTSLSTIFNTYCEEHNWETLSMGMSGDFNLAIECGSNMIRVGSKVFATEKI